MHTPVIVVVAYNRPNALKRLLHSLTKAVYFSNDVKILISIDRNDADPRNSEVISLAESFDWPFGPKVVQQKDKNIGLRQHILECGDMLLNQFESIILLEDDLFVSPYFYEYASQSIAALCDSPSVCGVSLYSPAVNEYTSEPFVPLDDGYDNYFVQSASSWGQLWTRNQWRLFREWYNLNSVNGVNDNDNLPSDVSGWPETSWKKYFIKYQVETNRYFSFPRRSLSTNFSEIGTHFTVDTSLYQTPLLSHSKAWNFSRLEASKSKYDCFYELSQESIKILFKGDIEFDLYGTKRLSDVTSKYLVSRKNCRKPIVQYSDKLIPSELNIFYGIGGSELTLGEKFDFDEKKSIYNFKQFEHLGLTFLIRLVWYKTKAFISRLILR